MIDGVTESEVRSKRGRKGSFSTTDDGLAVLLPLETVLGPCRRQEHTGETGFREKHSPKWQDCRIIAVT